MVRFSAKTGSALRYGMLIPLALLIASITTCCVSYLSARHNIVDDLNEAMFVLANENSELWTRPDTIAAICHLHETTHRPLIYQASDVNFRTPGLREVAYFTISPADPKNYRRLNEGDKIVSDSIMLMADGGAGSVAIAVQGFADCSMASVFLASDQTLPGILLSLSILSMAAMLVGKRKESEIAESESTATVVVPSLDGIKLTPMQRKLAQMLLSAPGMRVDKSRLCESLWVNKSNAEESLYTLVKRTKNALAQANIDIVCNRGESYELRIND